jgi:hypothetical protein
MLLLQHSELRILSVLQLITKIAQDLLSQLHSTAKSLLCHSDLLALITSAFNDLLKCANIVNTQAPISSLPADILRLIFQNVHHDEIQTTRHPLSRQPRDRSLARFQCPMMLSHVSRSWYDIVHDSPFLWMTVDILYPWNPSLVDMFFARSNPCSLYLNIVAEYCGDDYQRSAACRAGGHNVNHDSVNLGVDQFCDALVPHIPRCRSISICIDKHHESLSEALHRSFRDLEAPFLEQLFLQVPSHHSEPGPSRIFTRGAPVLSYLHFNCGAISRWHPPFTSLTSLHLQMDLGLLCSQFVAVVTQCPLLETLAMYDYFVFDQPSLQITLPHLRSFQLYGTNLHVADLLLGISAPVLQSLVISPFHRMDVATLRLSSGPMKFTAITSITLAPFHEFGAHDIVDILRMASESFPNVTDLTILAVCTKILRAVADGLAGIDADREGNMLFPNMQSLALRNIPSSSRFEPSLNSLISCRISEGKPLQTLCLDKHSMELVAGWQWLHDHVEVVELDRWAILRMDSLICDEEDVRFYPHQG